VPRRKKVGKHWLMLCVPSQTRAHEGISSAVATKNLFYTGQDLKKIQIWNVSCHLILWMSWPPYSQSIWSCFYQDITNIEIPWRVPVHLILEVLYKLYSYLYWWPVYSILITVATFLKSRKTLATDPFAPPSLCSWASGSWHLARARSY